MSFICFFWFVALDPIRVSVNHLKKEFCWGTAVGAPHGDVAGMSLACPTAPAQSSLWGHQGSPSPAHLVPPWRWDLALLWDLGRWGPWPGWAGLTSLGQGWWPQGLTWGLEFWHGLVKACWCHEPLDTFQSFTDSNFVLKTCEIYPLAQYQKMLGFREGGPTQTGRPNLPSVPGWQSQRDCLRIQLPQFHKATWPLEPVFCNRDVCAWAAHCCAARTDCVPWLACPAACRAAGFAACCAFSAWSAAHLLEHRCWQSSHLWIGDPKIFHQPGLLVSSQCYSSGVKFRVSRKLSRTLLHRGNAHCFAE